MFRDEFLKSLALVAVLGLVSCDGMFDGIYDDSVPSFETGITSSKISVDASSYSQWVYINFHSGSIQNVDIKTDSLTGLTSVDEPEEWDIAIHRFQIKTNKGAAIETEYTTLESLVAANRLPDSSFVPDMWYDSKVIIDISGMMQGNVKYCPSDVNDVVGRWITSSGMPPTYTTSDKVYVIRLADETLLALHFDSYLNNEGIKGFITCSYKYPLTF